MKLIMLFCDETNSSTSNLLSEFNCRSGGNRIPTNGSQLVFGIIIISYNLFIQLIEDLYGDFLPAAIQRDHTPHCAFRWLSPASTQPMPSLGLDSLSFPFDNFHPKLKRSALYTRTGQN